MKKLIKANINNTIRYIDDLLVLNNPSFEDAINYIYPTELQLKKTTENVTALSYLDIHTDYYRKWEIHHHAI